MTYQLGVDLGTTYTAAAVGRDGRIEVVTLGSRAASIPSVLFLKEDGTLLVGDPANRRGLSQPDRVVREFKRRFGDPTPILVGGTPISADTLMAKLLRWVVDTVAEQEGGLPSAVAVSHPANWGPYKLDLLAQALRQADLPNPTTVTEPEAAAMAYASTERLEAGEVIAVYDLGGGTFDAAVLRKQPDGFEVLGRPEGLERLGGIDFDEAVYGHVAMTVADALAEMDPDDPGDRAAVARLREECVEAKEALSADTDVTIPILLTVRREVRLTRREFEDMIRPALDPTIDALERTIASAGLGPAEVKTVVLVGGSSRIPLVGQLLASALGRPISIDVHPKHAVATGAALSAGGHVARSDAAAPVVLSLPPEPDTPPPPASGEPDAAVEAAFLGPSEPPPTAGRGEKRGWRDRLPHNRVGRVVLIVVVLLVLLRTVGEVAESASGGGGNKTNNSSSSSSTTQAIEPLPPFTLVRAKAALSAVVDAEQRYHEEHGRYTVNVGRGVSKPDFTVPGVTLERGSSADSVEDVGLITVWEQPGVILLNAHAEISCLYVRLTPDAVETIAIGDERFPVDDFCVLSSEDVLFDGQQWPLSPET